MFTIGDGTWGRGTRPEWDKTGIALIKIKVPWGHKTIIADGGYSGQTIIDWVKENLFWKLEIVKRPDSPEFKVLPKRWIVERTLAWISYSRRNSRDYEKLTETSEAMTQLSMIRIYINRF